MDLVAGLRRFDVVLVELDPTIGSEIRKCRPAIVISPDEMNRFLKTVIVAPMTTTEKSYPSRISLVFDGKRGQIALDQIRAVANERLVRVIGRVEQDTAAELCDGLTTMFRL